MGKKEFKWLKRAAIALGAVFVAIGLSSCTKSFCSIQDQSEQLFSAYGNIFNDKIEVTIPEGDTDYTEKYSVKKQNDNRKTLYSNIEAAGFTKPSKQFNAFMNQKAVNFANENDNLWMDGTFAEYDASLAYDIAWHVGIYAGIEVNEDGNKELAPLFTNYNLWYDEALASEDIGILLAPTKNFVNYFQTSLRNNIAGNLACISPTDDNYIQNGSTVFIEGKTWGEAFAQYGFLEGLFVYPFSYLVHLISKALPNSNGWGNILAIIVLTLVTRIISILSTLMQGKTQAKQQAIQPKLNALQDKYPNSAIDKNQKQAMAFEQAKIIKEAKMHPFLPLIIMILQFPIFICVWSALQGSAILASESWLGLSLTTPISDCVMNYANTPGALVGIFVLIIMVIANCLSTFTGVWLQSWKKDKFGLVGAKQADGSVVDPAKQMKFVSYGMLVFIVIMGFTLPAGMSVYWIFSAIVAVIQSILTEAVQAKHRHNITKNTGDGTDLASIRRSAHHQGKKKTEKAMWRK